MDKFRACLLWWLLLLPFQVLSQQEPWFVTDLKRESLLTSYGGRSLTVAILDDGIQCDYPDLRGSIDLLRSKSFVDTNPCVSEAGHGTTVANILRMVTTSSRIKIVSFKVTRKTFPVTSAVIAALEEIADWQDDLLVVNISLADYSGSGPFFSALKKLEKKALVISAAGNEGSTTLPGPCMHGYDLSNVLCVVAIDSQGKLWAMSNRGPRVEIASFGVALFGQFGTGTSFAAPVVSGLADLLYGALLAKGHKPTPALLKKVLIEGGMHNQNLEGLLGNPQQAYGAELVSLYERVTRPWLVDIEDIAPRASDIATIKVVGTPISLRQLDVVMNFRNENGETEKVKPSFLEKDSLTFAAPSQGRYWLYLNVEGIIETNEVPITIRPERRPHVAENSIGSSGDLPVASGQEILVLLPGFQLPRVTEAWINVGEEDWRELVFDEVSMASELGFVEARFRLPEDLPFFEGMTSLVLRVDGKFIEPALQIFLKVSEQTPPGEVNDTQD